MQEMELSSVVHPDPQRSSLTLVAWVRIRIQAGKNNPDNNVPATVYSKIFQIKTDL